MFWIALIAGFMIGFSLCAVLTILLIGAIKQEDRDRLIEAELAREKNRSRLASEELGRLEEQLSRFTKED